MRCTKDVPKEKKAVSTLNTGHIKCTQGETGLSGANEARNRRTQLFFVMTKPNKDAIRRARLIVHLQCCFWKREDPLSSLDISSKNFSSLKKSFFR